MSYSQQRTSLQISVGRAFVGGGTACHQLNILNPPWDSLSLKNISKWSIQPPSLISFIFVLVIPLSSLHTDQRIQLCILIWETRRDPTGPVHYKPRITTIPHPSSQYHPLLCVKAAFRGKIPRSICIWRSKGKPRPMGGGSKVKTVCYRLDSPEIRVWLGFVYKKLTIHNIEDEHLLGREGWRLGRGEVGLL